MDYGVYGLHGVDFQKFSTYDKKTNICLLRSTMSPKDQYFVVKELSRYLGYS